MSNLVAGIRIVKRSPRKQRAVGIYEKISDSRRILQEHVQYWEEDWGYRDLHFAKLSTRALRIEFFGDVSIDELEVFGEGDDKTITH